MLLLAQKRVVLIEDHHDLREQLHRVLSLAGYDVWSAENGEIGVALIRERRPDLVVTDLQTPGKDGFHALIELRDEFKAIKSLVISAGGAVGAMRYFELAHALGATDLLRKPFALIDFLARVSRLIGPARNSTELSLAFLPSQPASASRPLKLWEAT